MKRRKAGNIAMAVGGELLLITTLLLVFAFFHHVLPELRRSGESAAAESTLPTLESTLPTPESISAPADVPEAAEGEPGKELTEWQRRFAEHFSEEVVNTASSYTSPEVSVTVTPYIYGEGANETHYFVADIYVARIENFRTALANDAYAAYSTQPLLDMAEAHHAITAVNGDFYSYQSGGLMVRNGELYRQDYSIYSQYDICVLYQDGTMATYAPGEYTLEEVLERGAWQIWQFGPELLLEDGTPDVATVNTTSTITQVNPRCAIGYFEPGHYCFLVADGRQDGYSRGLRLEELAAIFSDLGCRAAYNLDGGGSAVMSFGESIVNRQSNGGQREISDILYIAEREAAE